MSQAQRFCRRAARQDVSLKLCAGSQVLLNDRVVQDAWGRYMLQKSGQHLETDLIYW